MTTTTTNCPMTTTITTTPTTTIPTPPQATPDHTQERWPAPPHRTSRTPFSLKTLGYGSYLLLVGCIALAAFIVVGLFGSTLKEVGVIEEHGVQPSMKGYYRYLVPFIVPVTAWFAIAHWIGWQFYANSQEDLKVG